MSINRCVITGNLTRDAELRSTQSGTQVLRMGVAVNERVKQQDGTWGDRPNYVDCVMFGTRAERVAQYLAKGTKVAVEGRLRYSSWEQDGQKRSRLEVVVDELEFMSRGDSQPSPRSTPQPQAVPYQAPTPAWPVPQPDLNSSDIPF